MNQKLRKQIIKSIAIVFSAVTVFSTFTSNTFYAVKNNNEAQADANQKNLNEQLLDLGWSDYDNHCCTKISTYENLIKQGADVNAISPYTCNTPLHYAAESGNIELCRFLLDNGADVNAKNSHGQTPLHYAIRYFDYIKTWKKEYDHDVWFTEGYAVCCGILRDEANASIKLLKLLLDRGADINAQDEHGCTPLVLAFAYKHQLAINFIINNDKLDVNLENKRTRVMTPLYYAINYGNYSACEILINRGAKVERNMIKYSLACREQQVSSFDRIFNQSVWDAYTKVYNLIIEKCGNLTDY